LKYSPNFPESSERLLINREIQMWRYWGEIYSFYCLSLKLIIQLTPVVYFNRFSALATTDIRIVVARVSVYVGLASGWATSISQFKSNEWKNCFLFDKELPEKLCRTYLFDSSIWGTEVLNQITSYQKNYWNSSSDLNLPTSIRLWNQHRD
jgi:hypothetical protein